MKYKMILDTLDQIADQKFNTSEGGAMERLAADAIRELVAQVNRLNDRSTQDRDYEH